MITFTEDFQRRLRAVLGKRTGGEIPADVRVDIVSDGSSQDVGRGMDYWIEIRSVGHPYAAYAYDEPGAWPSLLADLEAVPATSTVRLARVTQTSLGCPSQWDAWDAEGNQYYLRYRSGAGRVDRILPDDNRAIIATFNYGDSLAGFIDLADFARLAGIDISQIPEEQRS